MNLLFLAFLAIVGIGTLASPYEKTMYEQLRDSTVLVSPYYKPEDRAMYLFGIRLVKKYRWGSGHSHGTGVVVGRGTILTAAHVVRRGPLARIETADGRVFNAAVVAIDEVTDIALLVPVRTQHDVLPVSVADEAPMPGDDVWAFGHPGPMRNILTKGILSGFYEEEAVTDTVINPGNSGCGAFNKRGELVGIFTGIRNPLGVGAYMGHSVGVRYEQLKAFLDKYEDMV